MGAVIYNDGVIPLQPLMPVTQLVSTVCMCMSPFMNGSYGVLYKLNKRTHPNINTYAFFLYFALGVSILSLIVTPLASITNPDAALPFESLSAWGLFSGACFVGAAMCNYIGYDKLGIAVTQPFSAGIIIVASILWDLTLLSKSAKSPLMLAGAAVMIVCGLSGIMFVKHVAGNPTGVEHKLIEDTVGNLKANTNGEPRMTASSKPSLGSAENASSHSTEGYTLVKDVEGEPLGGGGGGGKERTQHASNTDVVYGIAAVTAMGLFASAVMLPMNCCIPEDERGLHYTSASFGLGVLAATLAVSPVLLLSGLCPATTFLSQSPIVVLPGVASGVLWGIGNTCYSLALVNYDFGVATSVWQLALLVACCWGVILFGELSQRKHISGLVVGSISVFVGILLESFAF